MATAPRKDRLDRIEKVLSVIAETQIAQEKQVLRLQNAMSHLAEVVAVGETNLNRVAALILIHERRIAKLEKGKR